MVTGGKESEAGLDKWYVGSSKEEGAVSEESKPPSGQPKYGKPCTSLHGVSDNVVDWNEFDGASIGISSNMG